MSPQEFIAYLQYPNGAKPDLMEVERLLQQYPYCDSLHVLKAKIYHLAGHPEAEKALNKAATYAGDRSFLYKTIKELQDSPVKQLETPAGVVDFTEVFENDILELKKLPAESAISEFEILEEKEEAPIEEQQEMANAVLEISLEAVEEMEEPAALEIGAINETNTTPLEEQEMPALEIPALTDDSPEADEPVLEIPTFDIEEKEETLSEPEEESLASAQENIKERKEELEDFTAWLAGLEAPKVGGKSKRNKTKVQKIVSTKSTFKRKPVKVVSTSPSKDSDNVMEDKGRRLKKLIKSSVVQSEEAVSETLARLLAAQGKKKKARWMYEQLSLKFPEKSAYFASQIKKLNK